MRTGCTISQSKILAAEAARLPRCIGGAGACPQEACRDAAHCMDTPDEHGFDSLTSRLDELAEERN